MGEVQKLSAEGKLDGFEELRKLAAQCQGARDDLGPLEQEGTDAEQYWEGQIYIFENYPNPFNPIVNVSFDIVLSGNIEINIFNISGAFIQTLYEGYLNSGNHTLNWNAESLPSGIYFILSDFATIELIRVRMKTYLRMCCWAPPIY